MVAWRHLLDEAAETGLRGCTALLSAGSVALLTFAAYLWLTVQGAPVVVDATLGLALCVTLLTLLAQVCLARQSLRFLRIYVFATRVLLALSALAAALFLALPEVIISWSDVEAAEQPLAAVITRKDGAALAALAALLLTTHLLARRVLGAQQAAAAGEYTPVLGGGKVSPARQGGALASSGSRSHSPSPMRRHEYGALDDVYGDGRNPVARREGGALGAAAGATAAEVAAAPGAPRQDRERADTASVPDGEADAEGQLDNCLFDGRSAQSEAAGEEERLRSQYASLYVKYRI
jgi:hypothetical protein